MSSVAVVGAAGTEYISSTSAVSYADARAGATFATPFGTPIVGQDFDGSNWIVYEGFFVFDLSVLGGAFVSAAELNIASIADQSTTDFTIVAAEYTGSWYPGLASSDYVPGASLSALTELATFPTAGMGTGLKLMNNTGTALLDAVRANQAGDNLLEIVLFSSRTRDNNTPSGDEWMAIQSTDFFPGPYSYLSLTYATPIGMPLINGGLVQ